MPEPARRLLIENFFRSLYGDDAPGYLPIVTFAEGGARAQWFPAAHLSTAASVAERLSSRHDVYFGIGLHGQPHGDGRRGTAAEVIALPGFWLELDWRDPAHKKAAQLPPTDAALALLEAFPLEPTLAVASGHGAHVWWLFREPWVLETPEENREAADLSRRLQGVFLEAAARNGWTLDNTADLARVLRPVGTYNRKREPAVPVRVLVDGGPRYNPSDFRAHLPAPPPDAPRAPESAAIPAPTQGTAYLIDGVEIPRHDALRGVSVHLAALGLPASTIEAALRDLRDHHTSPGRPITDAELARLAASAPAKYAPASGSAPACEPPRLVSVAEIWGEEIPTPTWLMPGWAVSDIHLVAAPGGTSKSMWTFAAALAIAAGTPILGEFAGEARRVLVIQEEDPPDISKLRVQRLMRGMGLTPDAMGDRLAFTPFRSGFYFGSPSHFARLQQAIEQHQPAIIFVDSVSQTADIADQNKTSEVRAFFRDKIEHLSRTFGVGLCLVHHTNKLAYQKDPSVELVGTITGSTSFVNCCDSVALIQGVPGAPHSRTLTFVKVRRFQRPPPVHYRFHDFAGPGSPDQRPVALVYEDTSAEEQPATGSAGDRAHSILSQNPGAWHSAADLARASNCSERTLRREAKVRSWETRTGGGSGSRTEYRVNDTLEGSIHA